MHCEISQRKQNIHIFFWSLLSLRVSFFFFFFHSWFRIPSRTPDSSVHQ